MLRPKTRLMQGTRWLAYAALLFLFAPTQARAQSAETQQPQPPAEQQSPRPDAVRQLNRALNLTRQQRTQITQIRRRMEPQGRALGARLRLARREFEEAIYADEVNESLIEERARAVAAAEAARLRLRAETELSIRRVLTAEQWAIFRDLRRRAAEEVRRRNQAQAGQPRPLRRRLRDTAQPPPADAQSAPPAALAPRDLRRPLRRPRPPAPPRS